MRNLSLLFTLMATVAIWNLTSCAGAGSTGTSASGSCVVSMDPYNDSLEQEKEELQRLEQEKAELQRQLEQEKAKQQRLEQEKAEQESYVGTFEITEEGKGNVRTIVLTVNDDETATMKYKDSEFIQTAWPADAYDAFIQIFVCDQSCLHVRIPVDGFFLSPGHVDDISHLDL